jgi:hypothetical protein
LLKEYALNAAFRVPTRDDQKLITKNEVSPIISHPKNRFIRLPEETKKTILIINIFKKRINLSMRGSYLKYAKVYIYTNCAIVNVKKEKLTDVVSIRKSNETL